MLAGRPLGLLQARARYGSANVRVHHEKDFHKKLLLPVDFTCLVVCILYSFEVFDMKAVCFFLKYCRKQDDVMGKDRIGIRWICLDV